MKVMNVGKVFLRNLSERYLSGVKVCRPGTVYIRRMSERYEYMMSVSVEVAIQNENKKNFSISRPETIKNHFLESIFKIQRVLSKSLERWTFRILSYALPTTTALIFSLESSNIYSIMYFDRVHDLRGT